MLFCKIICFEVFPVPHNTTNCLTDLKRGKKKHSFWPCAVIPTKYLKLGPGSKRWLCLLRLEMRTSRPPEEVVAGSSHSSRQAPHSMATPWASLSLGFKGLSHIWPETSEGPVSPPDVLSEFPRPPSSQLSLEFCSWPLLVVV